MKCIIALSGLLVVSMGCTEKETDSGDEEFAFAPQAGEWAGDFTVTENTCGFDMDEEEEGGDVETMTLTMVDDVTFNLADNELDFNCTLSGQDFTCEDIVETMGPPEGQMDAMLTMTKVRNGSFSSDTAGVVNMSYSATCEGADCETMANMAEMTLPCSMAASGNINLQ